jgi:hypothetical protein
MESLRSRELQKIAEKTTAILDETDVTRQNETIRELCKDIPDSFSDKVHVGESVIKDLDLDEWFGSTACTSGGRVVMSHIINNPIYDTTTLRRRADAITSIDKATVSAIRELRKYESTVLWALSLPTNIKDASPMHLLFPSWPVLRYINFIPWALVLLHIFRGYVSPALNVVYPLSGIIGPYFYVRKYLGFRISFFQYINFLRTALMIAMQPSSSLKQNATKYGTAILYVVVFVYGIVQGFDMAYLVRKMRGDLYIKMERLKKFVATAQRVTDARRSELDLFSATAEPVELEADMTSFYKLVTSPIMRERLGNLLKNTYIIDALCGMNKIVKRGVWSKCKYEAATTRLWGMGHPLLRRQVLNPLSLQKNIIITGPNAGGKTTYMKSICANIVLAQSIGYVCATRNEISTVHAIGTSIRVHDSVGSESLFEAEVKRCSSIALEARDISDAGKRAVYFLDEPMNSTPPIEGAATTMSIASYVGSLKGVRLFITTHYHEVTRLEEMHPSDWKNVSMEAIFDSNTGSYKFPYRIRAGPSFQCIALEILKERDLPDEIVDTAIEMKNKICEVVIDRHAS